MMYLFLKIRRSYVLIAALALVVVSPLTLWYISHPRYVAPVIESPLTEMKEVPDEVARKQYTHSPVLTATVPILMYHYIEYVRDKRDTIRQSLNVVPPVFEEQLKTLQNDGYVFLMASELGLWLNGESTPLPKKPILLTFDDGHRDFYTDVLPLLKKYHIHVTAYIIPGFTGGSDFMTQQELQEVAQSGLVELGAHTIHHISLKSKPFELVREEVLGSKKMLQDLYHVPVVSFAYPNGSFDGQAMRVVQNGGFTTSVSTIPGVEQTEGNQFFLYRLRPGGRVGTELLEYVQSPHVIARSR